MVVSNVPEHQFESMNTSNKEKLLYTMVDPSKIKQKMLEMIK